MATGIQKVLSRMTPQQREVYTKYTSRPRHRKVYASGGSIANRKGAKHRKVYASGGGIANRRTAKKSQLSEGAQKKVARMRSFVEIAPGYRVRGDIADDPIKRAKALASHEERQASTPRTGSYALKGTPSKVYSAMGLEGISAHSSRWDTVPIKKFGKNEIYQHPASNYLYIIGPEGQVAQYQPNHKRLYGQVGSNKAQTTKYPDWFDQDTVGFIKGMGGVTSDPFYTR